MIYIYDLYVLHAICSTYDQSKGEDTRELQSRMVAPQKKFSNKNWFNNCMHHCAVRDLKNEACLTADIISDIMKQEEKVNQAKRVWI